MTAETSSHRHTVSILASVALAAAFIAGSALPASAQWGIGRKPKPQKTPTANVAPAATTSSEQTSLEIDAGKEKYRLDTDGGTTYSVYRESDKRKIGSVNVATDPWELMPIGPDFATNNAALLEARAAADQGKIGPYNPNASSQAASAANAKGTTARPNAGTSALASDGPQVTFTEAGAVVFDPVLKKPVTISFDATEFQVEAPRAVQIPEGTMVVTFQGKNGDSAAKNVTHALGGFAKLTARAGTSGSINFHKGKSFRVDVVGRGGKKETVYETGDHNAGAVTGPQFERVEKTVLPILDRLYADLLTAKDAAPREARNAASSDAQFAKRFAPDERSVSALASIAAPASNLGGGGGSDRE